MNFVFVGLVAAAVSLASLAQTAAAESFRIATPPGRTVPSGSGSGFDVLKTSGDEVVYGIQWSERSDQPCWFKVYTARLTGTTGSGANKTYQWSKRAKVLSTDGGGCTENSSSRAEVFWQSEEPWRPAPQWTKTSGVHGVKAVEVCNSKERDSNKERLKGIRFHYTFVRGDGGLTNDVPVGAVKYERPNCNGNWARKVSCPAGQVASALLIYKCSGAGRHYPACGIGLECAAPVGSP